MKKILNTLISNQPQNILVDVYIPDQHNGKLVLFCHGFKGFKDWGAWHLVAEKFAKAGFVFVKFNFSHNGVGLENTSEFTRLDLFKENNYSREIDDVRIVMDWIHSSSTFNSFEIDELAIIGHSRGGGAAMVSALEDVRINKVVTWASIADFNRFGKEEDLQEWRSDGVKNFYNSRTKQDMEIGFQFYEDFKENQDRLDIEETLKKLSKPMLIVHGKNDDAVGFSHAQRLHKWHSEASLLLIENANHVFGAKHPYIEGVLPAQLQQAVDRTIIFLR